MFPASPPLPPFSPLYSFVGSKLQEHRGAFRLTYPMEHGVVVDWQDMEKIWNHVYSREQLNVPPEEHPVSHHNDDDQS